jgi:hypothetical protein
VSGTLLLAFKILAIFPIVALVRDLLGAARRKKPVA